MKKRRMLTTREAAELLGVDPSRIRQLCIAEAFPNAEAREETRGKVWYIPEDEVRAYDQSISKRGKPRKGKLNKRD
jgi:hypothetical protein